MTVGSELRELSILGKRNILSKVFVSEALTCEDPVESHLYDILENEGKPIPRKSLFPCYCESFPLCKFCQKMVRRCGQRRKSLVIEPKPVKQKNPIKKTKKEIRAKFID